MYEIDKKIIVEGFNEFIQEALNDLEKAVSIKPTRNLDNFDPAASKIVMCQNKYNGRKNLYRKALGINVPEEFDTKYDKLLQGDFIKRYPDEDLE